VNDALLDVDLYDSLDPRDTQIHSWKQRQQVPLSAPNLSTSNPSQQFQQLPPRSSNMNTTGIFMPSTYDQGPGSFLSHFGPDDQLFRRPLLNEIGQNYLTNLRPPLPPAPPQSQDQYQSQYGRQDMTYTNSYSKVASPQYSAYTTPQNPINGNNSYPSQQFVLSNQQTSYETPDPNAMFSSPVLSPARLPPTQQRTMATVQPRTSALQQHETMLTTTNISTQQTHQRLPSVPPQQHHETPKSVVTNPSNHREMFFTDHDDDKIDQLSFRQPQQQQPLVVPTTNTEQNDDQPEQDSRRQGIARVSFHCRHSSHFSVLF
jgi:hypothetical protein